MRRGVAGVVLSRALTRPAWAVDTACPTRAQARVARGEEALATCGEADGRLVSDVERVLEG